MEGYTIPKNSQIVPLLHTVHMNPNLWDAPEEFRPTRFLNNEGKVTKPEYFIPFGVGEFHQNYYLIHFIPFHSLFFKTVLVFVLRSSLFYSYNFKN